MESTSNILPTLDAEGYLVEPSEWNEAVALELAKRAGISMEEDHWDVVRFMRSYYEERQIAADVRHVIKHLAGRYGSGASNRIFELFPYGYVAQVCKIAGMKRPRGWSTG